MAASLAALFGAGDLDEPNAEPPPSPPDVLDQRKSLNAEVARLS